MLPLSLPAAHVVDHLALSSPVLVGLADGGDTCVEAVSHPQHSLVTAAQEELTPQIANDILGLAKVNLLQQVPHLELHVLDHATDIHNMLLISSDRHISLDLPRHVAAEIQVSESFTAAAEGEDDSGRELVLCGATTTLVDFKNVDAIPGSRRSLRALLEENDTCKAVVQVPEVDGRGSTFIVSSIRVSGPVLLTTYGLLS